MNNLSIVKSALFQKFPLPKMQPRICEFLQWVAQTQPELVKLIDRDPHKAAVKLSEIFRIVLSA